MKRKCVEVFGIKCIKQHHAFRTSPATARGAALRVPLYRILTVVCCLHTDKIFM